MLESVLYTTLSPCAMCSGAILLYGIPKVVIGENQTFMGQEDLLRSRGVVVEVLQDTACIDLMRHFLRQRKILCHQRRRSAVCGKACSRSSGATRDRVQPGRGGTSLEPQTLPRLLGSKIFTKLGRS